MAYQPRPGEIPTNPGVYRFRDAAGRVLYVGKAKNLRARLSNYFAPLHTLHERTRRMVTTAASVEWTVVASDVDSLQLEYMWIKEFDPPFNVRYKDDKSYPFMAITLADEAPRVIVTRNRRIPGAKYFGPYPKVWAVHDTIDLMIKVFPIRTCSDASYKKAMDTGRPCFPGQIGRCGGPCSMKVTIEEHRAIVDDFVAFMAGGDQRFAKDLNARMREASAAMDYEAAAVYRDRLVSIDAVLSKSALVLSPDTRCRPVRHRRGRAHRRGAAVRDPRRPRAGCAGHDDREGTRHLGRRPGRPGAAARVRRRRARRHPAPGAGPVAPRRRRPSSRSGCASGEGGSSRSRSRSADARPSCSSTATLNAQQALMLHKTRRTSDYVARTQALTDLQEALGLAEAPLRIECYDVSHLSGTNVVASMVVFEDGLPRKDQYRSFGVPETTDDTDSLHQVLTRRLAYLDRPEEQDEPLPELTQDGEVATTRKRPRFAYPPQLLVVDGGQPQVEAAARALADAGHEEIALCGIAKRLEEVWMPGEEYPVILPRTSEALYLLQRLRDEAHRFAITHQRRRRRRDIQSVLAEIPGLGDARIRALLRHFGSVTALKRATPEEIAELPGVGPKLAAAIHAHLSNG